MRFLLLLFSLLCMAQTAQAEEKYDWHNFSKTPVLFEGRVMPLDSFAEILLKKTSAGKYTENDIEFLAQSLFKPEDASTKPVFYSKNKTGLSLDRKEDFLYSYVELDEAFRENSEQLHSILQKPFKSLSLEQQNLVELYENHLLYGQILRAMTGFIPVPLSDENISYFDLQQTEKDFSKAQKIIAETEENFAGYSDNDQDLISDFFKIEILKKTASNNQLFKVIGTNNNNHSSPWEILNQKELFPKDIELLKSWEKLTTSFRNNNPNDFNKVVEQLAAQSPTTIQLEKIYNTASLNGWIIALLGLNIGFTLLYLFKNRKIFEKISTIILVSGTALLLLDIVTRIIISGRPPIGTLYESILFAALILLTCFSLLAFFKKWPEGILAGSVGGLILLLTAKAFVGEDSFSQLVAVLNTNFWLATHVVIITAGYGLCLIASLIAHIALIQKDNGWKKLINIFAVASLLFITVGTILGGLWADQSWGRFWGWDPKENGALLIALWLIWLLHGKISGHLQTMHYFAGIAYLSVIVALAWFGVNLLNVGLHSYGFIAGIAVSLFSFCFLQTALIGFLLWRVRKTS